MKKRIRTLMALGMTAMLAMNAAPALAEQTAACAALMGDWNGTGLVPSAEGCIRSRQPDGCGVVFNTLIMDQLGITKETLQTESGVLTALAQVRAAEMTVDCAPVIPLLVNGSALIGQGWAGDHGAVGALTVLFGGVPVDAEGNWVSCYRLEAFRHAVRFLNTCVRLGYADEGLLTLDRAACQAACRSARVFCFIGDRADAGDADAAGDGFAWYSPGEVRPDSRAGLMPLMAWDSRLPGASTLALSPMSGGSMVRSAEAAIMAGAIGNLARTELADIILTAAEEDVDARLDAMITRLDELGLSRLEDERNAAIRRRLSPRSVRGAGGLNEEQRKPAAQVEYESIEEALHERTLAGCLSA